MEPLAEKKNSAGSSSLLAPGFRFHPTDEELVWYYLRRKVCGKGFRFDAISDVDIYRIEPWDLPSFSKLKTRDLEWYFFSGLDKKYGNGARTNRATEKGYWKTTGKDRVVYHKTQIVGMKKTLVFHSGRAPKGQRTNWVMHEYRLIDPELDRAGIAQDAYVLCRVFQKSGSGPKNGEQYGAPFVEEEWEDDELEFVPKVEVAEEVDFSDDAYLHAHDLEQIPRSDVPSNISPLPLDIHTADASYGEETAESIDDTQQLVVNTSEQCHEPDPDMNIYDLFSQSDTDVRAVKHEYIGESSKSLNLDNLEYLLDESFFDSSDNLQFGNGGFLEANDLSNPIENNTRSDFEMFEEYLAFLDADDSNAEQFTYDPSIIPVSKNVIPDQALLPLKELNDETEHSTSLDGCIYNELNDETEHSTSLDGCIYNDNDVTLSSKKLDSTKHESGITSHLIMDQVQYIMSRSNAFPIYLPDFQYSFIQKASHMLGSISAPPALAAEFPSKEAARRLSSLYQPSSSSHVTAGMIQIQSLTSGLSKAENINVVLSFGVSQGEDGSASLESSLRMLQGGKSVSMIWRGWFYFICLWVLILSMSLKIGTSILAK